MEGPPLRPENVLPFVGEPPNAVWILPTAEAQERNLTIRGGSSFSTTSDPESALRNRVLREILVAQRHEEEALRLGAPFVRATLEDEVESVYAAVEQALLPALAGIPQAVLPADRFEVRRWENDALAAHLHAFLEKRPDLGTPGTPSARFACECGAQRDFAEVELTLAKYATATAGGGRVLAPDHRPTPEWPSLPSRLWRSRSGSASSPCRGTFGSTPPCCGGSAPSRSRFASRSTSTGSPA